MTSFKLDDEFGDLHPSGVLIQRALDRKGITLTKLAQTSGYPIQSVHRLLRLQRKASKLIEAVLLALVELECFTSMHEANSYLDEIPADKLTTDRRNEIISNLKRALDANDITLPETESPLQFQLVGLQGKIIVSIYEKDIELLYRFYIAAQRIKMAQVADKTPDEVLQATEALKMFDLGEVAQAIVQLKGLLVSSQT